MTTFDRVFKTTMMVLLGMVVILMWLGLDVDDEGYDDPNVVAIEYECDKLEDYEKVPSEVAEECKKRDKE